MPRSTGIRAFLHGVAAGCVANIGLKIVSIVIAVIIYVLVRRAEDTAAAEVHPPACVP